ncbi:MAG: type II toxin-antitoxin system VapC family toxin [Planctomycetia bacterium]|nr:type II toxin-antitoxin system VapC family toxin [Planctomycetia bacterium]
MLDANVAMKWVLAEPDSARANALRGDFLGGVHELLAPDVFAAEIAHGLTRAERRKLLKPPQGKALLADVLATCPHLHPFLPLLDRAFDISSAHRHGLYDCLYIALAEQESCELVTADDKLIKNLKTRFPFIGSLAMLP